MEKLITLKAWNHQITRVIKTLNFSRLVILISVYFFIFTNIHMQGSSDLSEIMIRLAQFKFLLIWSVVYLFLTLFSFYKPDWQRQKWIAMPNASIVIDITMIAILTYLLGGTSSGSSILILPFLATSCLLSYGRYPLLYGSYATSLIIIEILARYLWQEHQFNVKDAPLLFNQLILVAAYYLVPILTSFAASHLVRADRTVREHQIAYDRLNHLNQIITNRMQEAAIVLDNSLNIWLINRKAQQYFPQLKLGQHASLLKEITHQWRKNINQDFDLTCKISGKEMYIRAIPLLQEEKQFLTIFLRSAEERLSEAQTFKLTALGQLTANLAHEIRNPLSAVRQANNLLSESEDNNPIIHKLCSIIENNVARIDKMIEDISSLNKRDHINTELIDLKKFWQNFVQEFQLTNPESSGCLKLQLSSIRTILFDKMHLQQIFWNLCNNAWRHSNKRKDAIIISIHSFSEGQLSIRFWDNGPGVSQEHIGQLFEPFFTTQSHKNGTGLGLYVARELAHANRGDLRYLAKEKAFELILPKANHD